MCITPFLRVSFSGSLRNAAEAKKTRLILPYFFKERIGPLGIGITCVGRDDQIAFQRDHRIMNGDPLIETQVSASFHRLQRLDGFLVIPGLQSSRGCSRGSFELWLGCHKGVFEL